MDILECEYIITPCYFSEREGTKGYLFKKEVQKGCLIIYTSVFGK